MSNDTERIELAAAMRHLARGFEALAEAQATLLERVDSIEGALRVNMDLGRQAVAAARRRAAEAAALGEKGAPRAQNPRK